MIEVLPGDPVTQAAADWLRQRLPAGARLTADSREVRGGDAFFAWPGGSADGRRFCAGARAAGAAALVVEAEGWGAFASTPVTDAALAPDHDQRPQNDSDARRDHRAARADDVLPVVGLRQRAGPIASAWLGEPSRRLAVVAVTGTNGKTSCTHWIAAGSNARAGNERAVIVGTLGAGLPGRLDPSSRLTTPDALQLQQLLARFVETGVELVAIEASSIGLIQHRLAGTQIAVAVMTNLSRDHLDVHGSMSAYAEAKGRLFDWSGLAAAVVNLDDPAAAAMLARVSPGTQRIGYTLAPSTQSANPPGVDTVIRAEPLAQVASQGASQNPAQHTSQFTLAIGPARRPVRLGLLGDFNRANALAVAGVWHALGWSIDAIATALAGLQPVPGRLQMVGAAEDLGQPLVVVDYAHTPDALSNVLQALRPIAAARGGRLWCLFGAGGDRDRGKRPDMSRAAAAAADRLVLSSDNPRSEAPRQILADLLAGLTQPPWLTEIDRARAIDQAVAQADAADVILLAGKGHENYQEIAGQRHPFSDLAQARAAHDRHWGQA